MTDEIVTNEANNSIDPQMYDFNGSQVRIIVDENGDILFCGKDVADSLGYSNSRDALKKRCKGVAKRYPPSDKRRNSGVFIHSRGRCLSSYCWIEARVSSEI